MAAGGTTQRTADARTSAGAAGRRAAVCVVLLTVAIAMAGCTKKHDATPHVARTWVDQPKGDPSAIDPYNPNDQGPPPVTPKNPKGKQRDPIIVADHLEVPWGIAILPSGNALVTERSTGRILSVEPQFAPAALVQTITNIDGSGDGGLLGLALSPTYGEDGLIYAYVTTRTDNRIIRFALGQRPQAIFTGIPRGATGNGGRIAFGPDGNLYVGTGDAGKRAVAAQPRSLAGKILRLDVFGKAAKGNPVAGSPVFATGFRDVTGLCWDSRNRLYATDIGAGTDEVDDVRAGMDYGWPAVMGDAHRPGSFDPAKAWATGKAAPGGCAVLRSVMYVGQLNGKKISGVVPPTTPGQAITGREDSLIADKYGRIRSVVVAPDGAVWATTSNRDGHGRPVAADDRVLRIFTGGGSDNLPL